ncbi:MAG: AAA family ATP:ADP antiporter [Bacteriovoracaceae bacterium]
MASYPFIRASATALFIQHNGAKNSPLVWLGSVATLSLLVTFYNFFQTKFKIQTLFLFSSIGTCLGLYFFYFLLEGGNSLWSYPLFILKEAYIVLLFHMVIGFLNSSIDLKLAKSLLGPLGAVGSLGGMLGGIITSSYAKAWGLEVIILVGVSMVLLAGVSFWFTDHSINLSENKKPMEQKKDSLFSDIGSVKAYVLSIAGIIALAQFAIALMNFKFNIQLETFFPDKIGKTEFLAQLYTAVNGMSLFLQLLVLPIALKVVKLKNIHLFLPSSYLGLILLILLLPYGGLWPVALGFWFFKSFDYSVFQASKELLYYPLGARQKFAAKYLNDLVVYRLAKGAISLILIFIQSPILVNIMLVASLVIWAVLLIPLFKFKPVES